MDIEEYHNENKHNDENSDANNNTSNSNANIWIEKENQVSYAVCATMSIAYALFIQVYVIHILASGEVSGTLAPTHVSVVVDGSPPSNECAA